MAGGKISEALIHGLTLRESADDGSDFSNPTTDYRRLFLGEDGELHLKDSAGAVTDIGATGGGIPEGTSFPGGPATGEQFRRTDIRGGMTFTYDGTRWLSDQVYTITHSPVAGLTADNGQFYYPIPTDFQIWVPRWHVNAYVIAAATWVVTLQTHDFDNVIANIATRSTAGQTASKMYHYTDTVGVAVNGAAGNSTGTMQGLAIFYDESTGTTTFFGGVVVEYQLIAT